MTDDIDLATEREKLARATGRRMPDTHYGHEYARLPGVSPMFRHQHKGGARCLSTTHHPMTDEDLTMTELHQKTENESPPRFLVLPEVESRVGLRKSAIYDRIQKGIFPRPRRLGPRRTVWLEADISSWILSQR